MKVGVVGLGKMGGSIAKRLLEGGFELIVYDISREAVENIVKAGGKAAKNLEEVASFSDVVITSLPNDVAVEAVYLGKNGLVDSGRKGQIFIEMSTITPHTSRKIAELAERKGIDWLDAPVFGGPLNCGKWTLPVGGKEEVLERAKIVLKHLAENIYLIGGVGCGHITKLCNNILTGINFASVAEVMNLAALLGVNPKKVLEAISNSPSAGNSNALKNYNNAINYDEPLKSDFDTIFTIDLMYKDLDLVTRLAREYKMPLITGNIALQIFEIARAKGLGREDVKSVLKVYKEWSKL